MLSIFAVSIISAMKSLRLKYFTHDPQQLQLGSLETVILGSVVCAEPALDKNGMSAMPIANSRREMAFIFNLILDQ